MPRLAKSVYIVIVNWNGLNDTVECLESCARLDYPAFKVVVVDNGSSDGSQAALKRLFPEVQCLQTGNNLGYAGGNNVGIRYALNEQADYVWLLNNDTWADSRALAELVAAAETDQAIGMAGSKILCYADPSLIHYAGGRLDVRLGATVHTGFGEKDAPRFNLTADTDYITGCSLLIKSEVVEKIGLMDEGYFLYFEESEWCVRAKRAGYRLVYAPASVIYHKESASTSKISGALTYYMTRNRLYFLSRNGKGVRWLKRFAIDIANLLKSACKKELSQSKSILAAYRDWCTGYRGCYLRPGKR